MKIVSLVPPAPRSSARSLCGARVARPGATTAAASFPWMTFEILHPDEIRYGHEGGGWGRMKTS